MKNKQDYFVGSGNVFDDMGYANADELLAKAELALRINSIIEKRALTQQQAARVLRIDQPKVSALKRGRLSGFSLERLVRFLLLLGRDVRIVVVERRSPRKQPRLQVA